MKQTEIKIADVVVADVFAFDNTNNKTDLNKGQFRKADASITIPEANTTLLWFLKDGWPTNENASASNAMADQVFDAFFKDTPPEARVKARVFMKIHNVYVEAARTERVRGS
jgi:hypothetical protein